MRHAVLTVMVPVTGAVIMMSDQAATKGLFRVETYSLPRWSDKPYKRTEFLQMRWAIAERIKQANHVARFAYSQGRERSELVVIVSEWGGGDWVPIDGRLFTCEMQPYPATQRLLSVE